MTNEINKCDGVMIRLPFNGNFYLKNTNLTDNNEVYFSLIQDINIDYEDSKFNISLESGNVVDVWPGAAINTDSNGIIGFDVASLFAKHNFGDLSLVLSPRTTQSQINITKFNNLLTDFRLNSMDFSGLAFGKCGQIEYKKNDFNLSASIINDSNNDDHTTFTIGYDGNKIGGGLITSTSDFEDTLGGGLYYNGKDIRGSICFDSIDDEVEIEKKVLFSGIEYDINDNLMISVRNKIITDSSNTNDEYTDNDTEIFISYKINNFYHISIGYINIEHGELTEDTERGLAMKSNFSFDGFIDTFCDILLEPGNAKAKKNRFKSLFKNKKKK